VGNRNEPTELELCVLGLVAQEGPCTTYVVRKHLDRSLSSYWSSSAGSIYPLMERLLQRGWILVREDAFGTRRRRSFRISAHGTRQLERWLCSPVQPEAAAHAYDPLRTRVFFLDLIDPSGRYAYLEDAQRQTLSILERHRRELDEATATASDFELLGRHGAIEELEGRLRWIRRGLTLPTS
jgi:DNA-binding PadR family transcriptional regulator